MPRRPSTTVGTAPMSWRSSSPVKTQLRVTPLSSITRGSAAGTRAGGGPSRPARCPWGSSWRSFVAGLAVVLEERSEPLLGPEDPGLHRSHGAVHDAGHVVEGQPLDLREHEGRPELFGNSPERAFEIHVSALALAVLGGRVVEHRGWPVCHARLAERRLALPETVEGQEGVPQDLKHPGPQMGSRLEAVGEAERADIRLLDQVLGLGAVARQVDGEVVERVEMLEGLLPELVISHDDLGRRLEIEPAAGRSA